MHLLVHVMSRSDNTLSIEFRARCIISAPTEVLRLVTCQELTANTVASKDELVILRAKLLKDLADTFLQQAEFYLSNHHSTKNQQTIFQLLTTSSFLQKT